MSDNERFTLYKYYECLVNKLIKIRGSRKYLSDSLEEKYATSINRLIDDRAKCSGLHLRYQPALQRP